jgi:phosphonate transport system substrate-binding protein
MGISQADKYFNKVVITGSHENAVMALAQGTVDVCANWWNNDNDSNLTRMLTKNMVKDANGKILTKADFRVILTSSLIINSPTAYLASLPEDLRTAIRQAFLDAPKKAPEAFARLSDGKNLPWAPITNADYDDTIKLIKFVDQLAKHNAV